jgi:hypothetical protein
MLPFAHLDGKLGGTVGDIESAPFVEAMRQFQFRVGHENFALIHVSLVPDMHGEQKTKPTQTTVHALRGLGLLPDLVRTLTKFPLLCTCSAIADARACVGADCMSAYYPPTAGESDEGKDFDVLSRCI